MSAACNRASRSFRMSSSWRQPVASTLRPIPARLYADVRVASASSGITRCQSSMPLSSPASKSTVGVPVPWHSRYSPRPGPISTVFAIVLGSAVVGVVVDAATVVRSDASVSRVSEPEPHAARRTGRRSAATADDALPTSTSPHGAKPLRTRNVTTFRDRTRQSTQEFEYARDDGIAVGGGDDLVLHAVGVVDQAALGVDCHVDPFGGDAGLAAQRQETRVGRVRTGRGPSDRASARALGSRRRVVLPRRACTSGWL